MKVATSLLALVSCAVAVAAAAVDAPPTRTWQPVDCASFEIQTEGSSVACGFVSVPRRHADPAGPAIRLATVVIEAQGPERRNDPLFIAQGGPGGSSIEAFAQALISQPELRPASNRDLVIWDQRGTLRSQPALLCPEVTEAGLASADEANADPSDAVDPKELSSYVACGERLVREVGDISAFNTVENAHDVESLRVALGYDAINFYGVSYGTELGQFLMRQHPETLRAVVLDAVVPLEFNLITDVGMVKQRIGDKYFLGCANDPRCNAAFPDLRVRFRALQERLDRSPLEAEVADPNDPTRRVKVRLDGDGLAGVLYQALYIRQAAPLAPYIVDRADRGEYGLLTGFLLPLTLFDDENATGMYMTVVCAERGQSQPEAAARSEYPPRLAREELKGARTLLEVCKRWNVELLPREVLEPVRSDVPTLLLSGDFDPITPPAFAERVAQGLSRARTVSFAGGTHGQAFEGPCANQLIQRFLDDPAKVEVPRCAEAPAQRFTTPADLIVIPPLRDAVAIGVQGGLWSYLRHFLSIAIGLALLVTAIPIYAIGEVIANLRGRRDSIHPPGWKTRFSAAAPWLPLLALVLFCGALVALVLLLSHTASNNVLLTLLGAVPSSMRWVFVLPLLGVVAVLMMATAAVVMWSARQRSVAGRVYYLILLTGAGLVLFGFWRLGFLTAIAG